LTLQSLFGQVGWLHLGLLRRFEVGWLAAGRNVPRRVCVPGVGLVRRLRRLAGLGWRPRRASPVLEWRWASWFAASPSRVGASGRDC